MSLTKTSKDFKKGLGLFIVLAIAYYIVILVIIPNSKNALRKLIPDKTPPNAIYGQLDPLKFTKKSITNGSPRYVLDTRDGKLPENLPRLVQVYKIRKPQYSYLAGTEAQNSAAILGYTESDLASDLKGDTLKWTSLLSGGTLEITKSTGEISANTNFMLQASEYKPGNINDKQAVSYATELLKKINRFDDTYGITAKGTQTVTLGRITGNTIINTLLFAEAQFARVDFYRQFGEYKVYGPDPAQGLISIYLRNPTLGNSPYNYPIMDINLHTVEEIKPKDKKTPIDPATIAKYPIIYPDEAWDEVKRNNGVIVNVTPKDTNLLAPYEPTKVETVFIKDIFLAYYEPKEYTPYLQPIYVFKGIYNTKGTPGGEITIYFPAITKQYIRTSSK